VNAFFVWPGICGVLCVLADQYAHLFSNRADELAGQAVPAA
jgi:hypothetical protein